MTLGYILQLLSTLIKQFLNLNLTTAFAEALPHIKWFIGLNKLVLFFIKSGFYQI